ELHIRLLLLGVMLPILGVVWKFLRIAPPPPRQRDQPPGLVYWDSSDPRISAPEAGLRPAINLANRWNIVVVGFPLLVFVTAVLAQALRE
ncbi:MAG TPA: hypothetical protein VN914_18820, partial [Polyangia bacterium]|nr:hypothetical protein [Polyangia bacterium]